MSETPAKKRQRVNFDHEDTVEIIDMNEPASRKPTPTEASRSAVAAAVASHPEPIQELAVVTAQKFTALKSRQRQQEQTKTKLDTATFTPRSARLNFQLTASDSVTESPDFKTLTAAVETATATWTATVKTAVCKVAELESKNTKSEIVNLFLTTFKRIAHLILLQEDPDTDLDPTVFAALILDHNHAKLLQHIGLTRDNAMTKIFAPTPYDEDVFTREFAQTVSPLASDLSSLMSIIFVDSWNSQLATYKRQAGDRAVSKQVREYLHDAATVQAAELMDTEPTTDPALLKDIIKKQVDQETRQLRAQLNKLQQAQTRSLKGSTKPPPATKKTKRGAPPQHGNNRAPTTKKNGRSPQKPSPNRARNRRAALAERPANASPSGKGKPRTKNSSNSSKKNGKQQQRSNKQRSKK